MNEENRQIYLLVICLLAIVESKQVHHNLFITFNKLSYGGSSANLDYGGYLKIIDYDAGIGT